MACNAQFARHCACEKGTAQIEKSKCQALVGMKNDSKLTFEDQISRWMFHSRKLNNKINR